MICKNCGRECEEGSKFCDSCGTPFEMETMPKENSFNDIKDLVKKLFSKTPVLALEQAASSKSSTWVWLLLANVIAFGFTTCNNITQIINKIIVLSARAAGSATSSVTSNPFAGMFAESSVARFKMPVMYSLFFPLVVAAVFAIGIEFASIFATFKITKIKSNNWGGIANVIGVASMPITAALIINYLLGFLFPSAIFFIFIASILISMYLLYEGLRCAVSFSNAPLFEFGLIVLIMCAIYFILSTIMAKQTGSFFIQLIEWAEDLL